MQEYDVALWRFWPSLFQEWTETVRDFSPQSAMYALMRLHRLRFVQKAAVRCGVSPIQRYYDVICPRLVEVSSHD